MLDEARRHSARLALVRLFAIVQHPPGLGLLENIYARVEGLDPTTQKRLASTPIILSHFLPPDR